MAISFADRIIKYVQYFSTYFLGPHFREEELFLFPSLNDTKVDKAIEQHKQIHNAISGLALDDKINSKKTLQKIAELVDEHVRYESGNYFHIWKVN